MAGHPARAEPGRRGQRHHVRADHARDDRDPDLGLPRDPDHGRVPGQLLRPLGLPLPAAQPRRRAPRHARRDRPALRDRRDRLRRGAATARLPADPRAPRDRRVRLRHGHGADRPPAEPCGRPTGATGATGATGRRPRRHDDDADDSHPDRPRRAPRRPRRRAPRPWRRRSIPRRRPSGRRSTPASAACSCSAVLAFQVPRTLKMLNPPSANDAAATTSTPTTVDLRRRSPRRH